MTRPSPFRKIGPWIPILSIILIFVALYSNNWYTIDYKRDTEKVGLPKWEIKYNSGLTQEFIHKEGIQLSQPFSEDITRDIKGEKYDVVYLTEIVLIISQILIFAFVVVGIVAGLKKIYIKIPVIIGLLAVICLIFVLFYFPVTYSDAIIEDENSSPWGPPPEDQLQGIIDTGSVDFAYYITLISCAILLVGIITLYLNREYYQ